MKDRDDKFFIPFPEYFKNKKKEIEVYAIVDFFFDDWPLLACIVFTKSESLEEIKKALEKDVENTKTCSFSTEKDLMIKNFYQKVKQYQPEEPGYKLKLVKGKRGKYRFDEKSKTLTLCIDTETFPDISKAFYYKAGVYENCDMWQ